MKTNENIRTNLPEDVIELGVASVDTKGPGNPGELGGGEIQVGISAE